MATKRQKLIKKLKSDLTQFEMDEGNPTIYKIQDGRRIGARTWEEFLSWGGKANLSNVKKIPRPDEDYNIYRDALKLRGVNLLNEPKKKQIYKMTNETLDKIYKGKPLNINLNFTENAPSYGTGQPRFGAYYADKKQIDMMGDFGDYESYAKYYNQTLLHEYAHFLGIGMTDDTHYEADDYARQYYPDPDPNYGYKKRK